MKFFVEVAAPADKGADIDAAGGPGPVIAELLQRFQPEAFYGSADARTLRFVADLPTSLDVSILMEICSDRLYAYPVLRPVIPIHEMQDHVTQVHAAVPHREADLVHAGAADRRGVGDDGQHLTPPG